MTLLQACVFSAMRSWNALHQVSKIWLLVEDAKISSQQGNTLICSAIHYFGTESESSPNSSKLLPQALILQPYRHHYYLLRLLRNPFHTLKEELGWDKSWRQVGSQWLGMSSEASDPTSSLKPWGWCVNHSHPTPQQPEEQQFVPHSFTFQLGLTLWIFPVLLPQGDSKDNKDSVSWTAPKTGKLLCASPQMITEKI